ncbi:MAG: tetratricopeptide repeat protein [Gemmobacter sp.]
MRHPGIVALCLMGMAGLAACDRSSNADVNRAIESMNLVDDNNMAEIMLTVADPAEAAAWFTRASAEHPDRVDLRRGLAKSLARAGNAPEAAAIWTEIADGPEGTSQDRVELAEALIRNNEWARAEAELNRIPPTHETFERYRLEAMVADANKNWAKADSFYEIAAGLTNRPSGVLNNWGFSKLTRGDHAGAERLFAEAITYDPGLFTAKNNLVMARGAQRKYDLPVIQMNQTERAQLLHTLALTAVKSGDVNVGKGLLQEAIDTHPQHFDAAVRSLRALDSGATG